MAASTIRNYIWSFLEQGGSKAIGIVVQIVLARLLAPDVFGIMAIVLIVINLGSVISQNGIAVALIQFEPISAKAYSTAFWVNFCFSCCLYIIIFLIAPFIAAFYGNDALSLYIRVLSLTLVINAFNSIQRTSLQRNLRFRPLCIVNLVAAFIAGVVAIGAASIMLGIWALIINALAQSIVTCIALTIVTSWKPHLDFDWKIAKELFSFGWKICISNVLNTLCSGLPELILGKTTSTTMLGYYSQGNKWPATIMAACSAAIENVIYPTLANLKHDLEIMRASIRGHLLNGSLIIMPICILAALLAEPLTLLLLTDKWLPSVPIFQLSSLSFFFVIPQIVNLRAYLALGDSKTYMMVNIAKIVIGATALSAVALFAKDIYIMALAAFLYTTLSILLIEMIPAKRIIGIGCLEQLSCVLPVICLSIGAAVLPGLLGFLEINYIVKMFMQLVLYSVLYIAGLYLFKIGNLPEILREIIGKKPPATTKEDDDS